MTPGLREHTHESCPNCGESLCAGLIVDRIICGPHHPQPYTLEEIVEMYGDKRCYGLQIGHEITQRYDGISYWYYPCCQTKNDRWTGEVVES